MSGPAPRKIPEYHRHFCHRPAAGGARLRLPPASVKGTSLCVSRRGMNRDSARLLGQSLALVGILLFFFLGWGPIVQALYARGLWPRPSVEDVQDALRRTSPRDSVACFPASDRFEFVCDVIHRSHGYAFRHKYGIVGGPFGPIGALTQLPADAFVTSAEGQARLDREWAREQQHLALLDLNAASLGQLQTLPGVDQALAVRIVKARARTRFSRVEDLLRIDGVDAATVERLRPLVRATTE
jgi:helix-hairpin-helix protein